MVIFTFSSQGQSSLKKGLGSFDISAKDKFIVFSYCIGISSIYIANTDGTDPRKVIGSKGDIDYYNPKFSPDGKKIVFVANKRGNINSSLCLSNADGANVLYLTDDKQIVTEATFSLDGETIYFCKANTYGKYSKIGIKDAHDFDIYSIYLKNKKISKISNLKSYGLNHISDVDNVYLLIHLEAGPDGGMYLYPKDNATEPRLITPINNPRGDPSLYYTPVYSDTLKSIGFTAPYEIYIMSLKDKRAKLVFSNKGSYDINNIAFFKAQKKILFSKAESSNLYSINTDGTGLKTISIIIK
jgi:Tol biopolymer transport system component